MIQPSQEKRKHPKLTFTCDSLGAVGAVCSKWNKEDAGLLAQELSTYFNFRIGFENLVLF